MGWTVLYIAFGIVALWLLGEVLLQYKARLRWRVLAFVGFAGVVLGVVALSSVIVIALGAIAFAVGQTFVTLSYRRGFSTGWALGGQPGSSRRRRGADQPEAQEAEPVLEVSGLEAHTSPGQEPQEAYAGEGYPQQAYAPQPMPDETGQYGVYERSEQLAGGPDGYPAFAQAQAVYADPAAQQQPYGYEEQHQYAPYADAYAGYDGGQYATTSAYGAYDGYDGYDAYGGGTVSYDPQGSVPSAHSYDQGAGGYGAPYAPAQEPWQQTPADGVWVPQQRESDGTVPPDQLYPYQGGYAADGYGNPEPAADAYGYGYGYGADGNGQNAYAAQNGYPAAENGYAATENGYTDGYGYDPSAGHYYYGDQRGY